MKNVSTAVEVMDRDMGLFAAVKVLKEAGFDCYDCTFCGPTEERKQLFSSQNYLESARKLRKYADELGIRCNQAHAQFPSSRGTDADAAIFQNVVENMEAASILGAEIIVVHPMQHLNYAEHQRELFALNVDFYKRLIPYAQRFGIKVATENMWQTNNGSRVPSDSVCSRAWEFCELIDAVDSPWLVGCLDIGHVSLMGADIPAFIRTMGAKRLQALHLHDTDLQHDSHTLPYTLKVNYDEVIQALHEIGYQGDITFEAGNFFRNFPEALLPSAAKLMADVGKYFASVIWQE